MFGSDPHCPTKAELLQLIEDRKSDPSTAELKLQPPWMLDANDENRKAIRQRERKINRMSMRLDKAVQNFEQEFGWNS
ncbi:hypothetical protein [Hyphomonas adhaerens]|uniref:hypothetical protein n=1 Tax=Hyphomonas adhaerens TaxID=81029 RepID=UPI002480DEF4|nr:hypothetical protein [Hyphomonas adhaerens]|tara:strand:+ start:864 stop:1097 length:234 start_codon:yes stop_codon:yes gene_type:complete